MCKTLTVCEGLRINTNLTDLVLRGIDITLTTLDIRAVDSLNLELNCGSPHHSCGSKHQNGGSLMLTAETCSIETWVG